MIHSSVLNGLTKKLNDFSENGQVQGTDRSEKSAKENLWKTFRKPGEFLLKNTS